LLPLILISHPELNIKKSIHGTSIVVCPAFVISITPAQLHITLELLLRAGWPATITVREPGAHGAAMTGYGRQILKPLLDERMNGI
jgi:hypothetical protein